MTVATIDIGTNTVLLLVAEFDGQGAMAVRLEEQRLPRVGKGVDEHHLLSRDSMDRVIDVLREYRTVLNTPPIDAIAVFGTSAVRDARNREEFASQVRTATGFELEVLSGDDEALWTYRGAISGLPGIGRATVVDIGGGSTEVSVGDRTGIDQRISLDLGSVRLTERIFRHDPPTDGELESAIEVIEDEIQRAGHFSFRGTTLIGVAGTATSLAIIAQGLQEFDVDAVTGYRLGRERIEELLRMLRELPSDQIKRLSRVMEGRHDVIIAGTLITREILAHFGFTEMVISERGVRYGIAIREWERRMNAAG